MSTIRKEARELNDMEKRRMEERLQILEKMVNSRLQKQHSHILTGERGDQEIHSGTIVEACKQVNIVLSSKPSDDLVEAIDEFFSGNFMSGLGKLVHVAVKGVLGNASMGEYETSQMFIVWEYNALLRYDAYCYRCNDNSGHHNGEVRVFYYSRSREVRAEKCVSSITPAAAKFHGTSLLRE